MGCGGCCRSRYGIGPIWIKLIGILQIGIALTILAALDTHVCRSRCCYLERTMTIFGFLQYSSTTGGQVLYLVLIAIICIYCWMGSALFRGADDNKGGFLYIWFEFAKISLVSSWTSAAVFTISNFTFPPTLALVFFALSTTVHAFMMSLVAGRIKAIEREEGLEDEDEVSSA